MTTLAGTTYIRARETGAEAYAVALGKARAHNGRIAAYVSPVSPSEAHEMAADGARFYAAEPVLERGAKSNPYYSAAALYVTGDGYLGGLYSRAPGWGGALLRAVLMLPESDRTLRLDCLGDRLADTYRRHGFRETFRAPFDPAEAPSEWGFAVAIGDDPTPDYIEMERTI